MPTCSYRPAAQLRQALLDGAELALIDVREEADFARSHPLFAANLPLSKLELDIFRRVPRLTTPITVYDGGEGLAERAVERLQSWGYEDVALLEGGLPGWQRSGGTLAWIDAGLALEHGETHLATPRSDRYQRPYEGTDNSPAAMQAYLDWEFGLVEQLKRDGTHGFKVL